MSCFVLFYVAVNRLDRLVLRHVSSLGRLDDERFGQFAGMSVWDLDNSTVRDERVVEEVRFQLGRSDLVALGTCLVKDWGYVRGAHDIPLL